MRPVGYALFFAVAAWIFVGGALAVAVGFMWVPDAPTLHEALEQQQNVGNGIGVITIIAIFIAGYKGWQAGKRAG